MSEEHKEETHIEKRRTTALKIVVDENIRKDEQTKREFLANLFDFQEYAVKEDKIKVHVTRTINGAEEDYIVYEEMLPILKENGVDVAAFKGYKEVTLPYYKKQVWDLDQRVKEITGIPERTYLHYRFSSSMECNRAEIHYLLFQLETRGKTKTEIKGVHKENVCKFLNYLKMRKVPYQYDCEWAFEGSRTCQL